ncbi:MAG: glycosyltransferase family 4 protein [Pseudomonadota bacterium]
MSNRAHPDYPITVAFVTGSSGDWGGASRVLFTMLRMLDRTRIEPVCLLPCDGPIVPELDERRIRHVNWGRLTEPGRPYAYLKSMWRMARFLRRNRIDAIHINHSNAWRPAELQAARILGIPILTHYHTVNDAPAPAISLSTGIITVSDYVAQHSEPRDIPKHTIHNPVDLARFDSARDIRTELGYGPDEVLVSFLGQVREIKGVGDFIAMAHRLPHRHVRFLIAGECRDPEKFEGSYSPASLEAAFGGDSRLRYLGYLDRVEDLYRASDIVVVPSRWQEPLGLINLEAGACRTPVVATRSGGIPEIVRDGETGFLVGIGDVEALAARVAQLIDNPALRGRLGNQARAAVERDFTTRPVRAFEELLMTCTHRSRT